MGQGGEEDEGFGGSRGRERSWVCPTCMGNPAEHVCVQIFRQIKDGVAKVSQMA